MPRNVAIEDGTLESLASNSVAVAALPHLLGALAALRNTPAPRGVCPKCHASAEKNRRREILARTRQAIAAMSSADQDVLKKLLNADTITVHITTPDGRVRPINV